jgi:DNA polymerase-3 subunit delta
MPDTPPTPAAAPPPLVLVTGPEELLRERAVAAVVSASRAAGAAAGAQAPATLTDVTHVSAVGLEPGVLTGLTSPSLFDERRVVVLRDVQDASEEVAAEVKRYVLAPEPDTAVVFVHNGGVKGKALLDAIRKAGADVVECKALKWESDKVSFVLAEFRRGGRRIGQEAAAALVDAVGSDLRELASSCSQLMADTTGLVDAEVVERYHAGRVEVTGFKVADAAVEGRCEEALGLLRQALATGADPVPVNAALAMALRNLARVGSAPRTARPDDLARELGMKPFVVRKARGQLAGWTEDGVAAAIAVVARADAQIKGAGTDPVYALERAVVAVARARTGR